MSTLAFYIAVFFILQVVAECAEAKGSVPLDAYTFDKVLSRFKCSIVKFDEFYPYGDKEAEYNNFAEQAHTIDDLLVATVGVRDYGDKDNQDLSDRFGVTKDHYPAVKLFVEGKSIPYDFKPANDDGFKAATLRNFVKQHCRNVYIGAPGCLEDFDKLAGKFIATSCPHQRASILKEAEKLWDGVDGGQAQRSALIYVKTMRKITEKGADFVTSETSRLAKLLKETLTKDQQTDFNNRLNILASFVLSNHDEL